MAQETVMINFEVDYTELTNAQQELSKTGKVDTKSFDKIQAAITDTATDTKGLIKQFKDVGAASIKMGKSVEDAFGAGIQDALDEAGVSVDEFAAALKKANAPAVTLKKELRDLKEALAKAKAAGKDTGKEFEALRARAGQLADAIADADSEIKNMASDTRNIDNVVGSISALAGGYSAVQGAAALFGDENEELQKSLLKVNGAMALATGLQQISNALQKEGALIKLKDSIATGVQSAAMTLYTFVTTGATVATKVFRAALLLTGIGAVIVLVVALVSAMKDYSSNTDDAASSTQNLADAVENLNTQLDEELIRIKRNGELQLEYIKQRGGSERELHDKSIQYTQLEIDAIKNKNNQISNSINAQLESIGLFGKGLVKNKEQAQDLVDNLKLISASLPDGNKQKESIGVAIAAIKSLSDNFKAISDRDAAITLSNEQFKTKVITDAEKIRIDAAKAASAKRKIALDKERADLLADQKTADANTIAANLARINKEIDQEFIKYNNLADMDAQFYETKKKNAADWDALHKEFQASLVKSSDMAAGKLKKTEEEKRAELIKTITTIVQAAEYVQGIFTEISNQQTAREQADIDFQRKRVQEQLAAGAITQKAADIQLKRIDRLEKEAKNKAAKREKAAAVFTAVLAIPKAFLQGLSTGGPVLGAVYAALAAVQAVLIASRPVPKFFRGKKDNYAGPGIVGDMGAELVERDGRMFLYTKPTQTYLGARDKVYTAGETRKKLHNSNLSTTVKPLQQTGFDYDRFAKAIPAASLNVNIDKTGITEWVTGSQSRTTYMDNRYRSK